VLPGWTRFPAATEWLNQHQQATPVSEMHQRSGPFLAQRGGGAAGDVDRARLFQQFLDWRAHERP